MKTQLVTIVLKDSKVANKMAVLQHFKGDLRYAELATRNPHETSKEIYLLTEDRTNIPAAGEYFMDITELNFGKIYQCMGNSTGVGFEGWIKSTVGIIKEPYTQCRKIVATTDKKLSIGYDYHENLCFDESKITYTKLIPQLDEEFLQSYCEDDFLQNGIYNCVIEANSVRIIKTTNSMKEVVDDRHVDEILFPESKVRQLLKDLNSQINITSGGLALGDASLEVWIGKHLS